jgi:pimeloyl-ACP methyl ester carboxylesterase
MFRFIRHLVNVFKPQQVLHVAFDSGGRRKPTIVLLHGIAATSNTWKPLIKHLDSDSNRIVAIDLLGFGESPKPTNCKYDVNDHAEYVRRTIKRLRIKRPFKIVGHSMGAIIAAHYSYLYPDDINEVYLLSLPLYNVDETLSIIARKRTGFYMKAYEFIMQNKDFTIKNSQFLRKLLKIDDGIDVTEETWNSFKLSLKNTIIAQDSYGEISNTKIPTHIIFGKLDEVIVPDNIKTLTAFKHVTITKLGGINHLLSEKYADVVAKHIYGTGI